MAIHSLSLAQQQQVSAGLEHLPFYRRNIIYSSPNSLSPDLPKSFWQEVSEWFDWFDDNWYSLEIF